MEELIRIECNEISHYHPNGGESPGEMYRCEIIVAIMIEMEKIGEFYLRSYDMWRAKLSGLKDEDLYDGNSIIHQIDAEVGVHIPEGEFFQDRINLFLEERADPYRTFYFVQWVYLEPEYRSRDVIKTGLAELARRYYGIWGCAVMPYPWEVITEEELDSYLADESWGENEWRGEDEACGEGEEYPYNCEGFTVDFELAMMKLIGHAGNLGFQRIGESHLMVGRSADLLHI